MPIFTNGQSCLQFAAFISHLLCRRHRPSFRFGRIRRR